MGKVRDVVTSAREVLDVLRDAAIRSPWQIWLQDVLEECAERSLPALLRELYPSKTGPALLCYCTSVA